MRITFGLLLVALGAGAIAACGASGGGDPDVSRSDAAIDGSADGMESDAVRHDALPPVDATDATPDCTPVCTGRACGTDGCGGSCGTCGAGTQCSSAGQCEPTLPICPCWAGDCDHCYCGSAIQTYGASHNCTAPDLAAHINDDWSCHGGTWTSTACSNGCSINPSGPDFCTPAPGGHHLWIVYDSNVTTYRSHTDAYFQCIVANTNFNSLTSAWSSGRSLAWGGSFVLQSHCSYHYDTAATVAEDSATFNCIESQINAPIGDDDVIAYVPGDATTCEGRNHWHIGVGSHSVEIAMIYGGSNESCQTALGTHEVYEASAEALAADCCNGEHGCTANPSPSGWYWLNACGQTWRVQTVSPAGHEWDNSYCQQLH